MSKRQKPIPEDALPVEEARHDLATHAAARLTAARLTPIGIGHFARPTDGLALVIAPEGRLPSRIIASVFGAHVPAAIADSQAS